MTAQVTHLFRHPIKSHGREALEQVSLIAGQTMPWDRKWAVAHEAARADGSEWAPCANFSRGSKAPQLMAINANLDEATGHITLSHPERPNLTFDPDADSTEFLDWVRPLMPKNRAQSARIVSVPARGMTDTDYPSVSINSFGSLKALSDIVGQDLSPLRWRGNIWIDGIAPWEEFDWIGKTVKIGGVELEITAPIERCLATTANPETGVRDADTLKALNSLGHQDFGVYARVLKSGEIARGDTVELL